MQPIKSDEFASRYTRMLTRAWSNDEFSRRLEKDPRGVLAENGLEIPAHAVLEIVWEGDVSLGLGPQFDLWQQGYSTRRFILHLPLLPRTGIDELREAELGDLAGGATVAAVHAAVPHRER